MADVNAALAGSRAALEEMVTAAASCAASWTVPRAPGKWSPSQLTEHVARALEESAQVVAGRPSKFPTFPSFVRPLVRGLFFNRVLKKGAFPKARTTRPFDPDTGPASPADAKERLEAAHARFDEACRARDRDGGKVQSTIFGGVSVADYVRFQELHTRNHRRQLPA